MNFKGSRLYLQMKHEVPYTLMYKLYIIAEHYNVGFFIFAALLISQFLYKYLTFFQ